MAKSAPPPNPALPELSSPVSVNGVDIPASEVNRRFSERFKRATLAGSDQVSAFRAKRAVISELVDEALLRDAAKKRGVTASPREVDEAVAAFGATFPSKASFDSYMAGPRAAEVRREQELLVLTRKLLGTPAPITEQEVSAFYERNRIRFDRPEHRRGNEIVFLASAGHDIASRARELRALRTRIIGEKLSFAAMARAVSEVPSKAFGGDLGEVTSKSLPAPLWRVLDALPEGGISEVIQLEDRAVLLQGRERVPAIHRTLAEAGPEIRRAIELQRFSASRAELTRSLRAAARIDDRFSSRYPAFTDVRFGAPAAGPALSGPVRAGSSKPDRPKSQERR